MTVHRLCVFINSLFSYFLTYGSNKNLCLFFRSGVEEGWGWWGYGTTVRSLFEAVVFKSKEGVFISDPENINRSLTLVVTWILRKELIWFPIFSPVIKLVGTPVTTENFLVKVTSPLPPSVGRHPTQLIHLFVVSVLYIRSENSLNSPFFSYLSLLVEIPLLVRRTRGLSPFTKVLSVDKINVSH